jgi:hypothetical protein
MKNGKISTSDMIRLLMKHAKDAVPWTATAPDTPESGSGWMAMTANVNHDNSGVFISSYTANLTTVPWREDWTIYRAKSNLRLIGEFKKHISHTEGLVTITDDLIELPKGTYRVYVESKP